MEILILLKLGFSLGEKGDKNKKQEAKESRYQTEFRVSVWICDLNIHVHLLNLSTESRSNDIHSSNERTHLLPRSLIGLLKKPGFLKKWWISGLRPGKYKVSMEPLMPKSKKVLKNKRDMVSGPGCSVTGFPLAKSGKMWLSKGITIIMYYITHWIKESMNPRESSFCKNTK